MLVILSPLGAHFILLICSGQIMPFLETDLYSAVINLVNTEGRTGKLNFGLTDETPREDV